MADESAPTAKREADDNWDEAISVALGVAGCLTSKVHPEPVTEEEVRREIKRLGGSNG